MNIMDIYPSAVNSRNLTSHPDTTMSHTDTLAAMGMAGRKHPLGAALLRLFVDGKVRSAVQVLSAMAMVQVSIPEAKAAVIAKKVLAWYRFGTCEECGGTGFEIIIEPKPHLSETPCHACDGERRRPFTEGFALDELEIARYLRDMIEAEQARAGEAAMRRLRSNMEL